MALSTVSAGLAAGLLAYALSRGADAEDLQAKSSLGDHDLTDPDARVPLHTYLALLHQAQEGTNDPALALHWGEDVDMAELSIVGLIMNAASTKGVAFQQLQRYGRLAMEINDPAGSPHFELTQQDGRLYMVYRAAPAQNVPELVENAFARLTCGPRQFLDSPHILSVDFTHPAPSYRDEYARIFQCPVHFEAKWNAMELHPEVAAWPVAQSPAYMSKLLAERADQLLAKLTTQKSVRGQVEQALLPLLHLGNPGADQIAAQLGMSRQTLFRRLKEENASYRDVLEELRHTMAMSHLKSQKLSVGDIAYLLGFSDVAAFSRAFKRWTGQSPRAFRQSSEMV
ncbi:AraC family transcriptional regulator [Maritalea mediterranea]|uniref:AraC family transcriptional regulator ligand-binding domain-containing protein n=1 Tax=Maritalea mediterranea TaxID=2909667 RepID=A0ABS9E7T3_9HYPH|nr:AraC family transcriptional regulator [Maritalea mediterranea]MCF4097488.1 AraC family transcriptional regulator ligand-binding domain-containing protein [Maritalea mediterranea]